MKPSITRARKAWSDMADFRSKRDRYMRFAYGDQWSDPTRDSENRPMTEGELARRQGRKPMTNNLIRRLVKCIVGRYRNLDTRYQPDETLSAVYAANSLDELDSRMLEEFVISGCAVQRIACEVRPGGKGVWVDNVDPSRFFTNRFTDPRGHDIDCIGMVHQLSLPEIIQRFANGSRAKAAKLAAMFNSDSPAAPSWGEIASGEAFFSSIAGRHAVAEIWTREASELLTCHDPVSGTLYTLPGHLAGQIDLANESRAKEGIAAIASRWQLDSRWVCRWVAPDGTLLGEHESPFADGSHPFAVKFYPMTDGEAHSLVEDVIDQQIYINRLITLIDHVIGVSAKGTLLIPINQMLPGWSAKKLSQEWAQPGSVLPYDSTAGPGEPHQINGAGIDSGALTLLNMEMKMFEDVSGVGSALFGKPSQTNAGAQRFNSEVDNALASISDILLSFDTFRSGRDNKIRQIQKLP